MSFSLVLGAVLVTAALSLAGVARGQSQPAGAAETRAAAAPSLYFLDGQPTAKKNIDDLNRRTIASVHVVKGAEAIRIFGAAAGEGVMVVVTKRNVASAAVAEFNRRYDIRPVEAPVVATPPAPPVQH
ncbi:hypothetical protein [Hymenobacter psychrophilus]|uniref:TonB-dependent outer membrane receptor, SusC/RagA subfamily, signature region n=1 Tax=Hymenobacter psychrophilus TaxID=651662 RepID=A0A1H3I2E4_9BACT|nr:hypothetical protein [Hymenobacter psychrophilus]SDY21782.1 hypothetical protein SAMN04488069_106254 [Hymenobacter psychrophilus]